MATKVEGNGVVSTRRRKRNNWYYLDRLPSRLRLALCDAAITWDAKWFLDKFEGGESVDKLIARLRKADLDFVTQPIKVQEAVGKKAKTMRAPTIEHGVRPLYSNHYL
jgi:Family of unknown function (DUF6525)